MLRLSKDVFEGNYYYSVDLSDQWTVGPVDCRINGLSDQWTVGPMDCL